TETPALGIPTPGGWTAPGEVDDCEPSNEPGWWKTFGDGGLDTAIEECLRNNHDLRIAAVRVDRAEAQAISSGADRLPALRLQADGAKSQRNFIGFPIPGTNGIPRNRFSNYGAALNLSWEIDIWGRLRSAKAASLADQEAVLADLYGARLSLVGQTCKAWFAALEATRQEELAAATVENYQASEKQVRERYERGLRSPLDLRLARANLATAEDNLESTKIRKDGALRQLEILLGRYPAAALEAAPALPQIPGEVPAGLPSELLARRPDMLSLERRLAGQRARLRQAKVSLLPRISLSSSTGTSTNELRDIVNQDFSVWSLAANLLQPIFQGGRLLAGIDLADSNLREALETYAKGALRAFAEVETTLALENFLARREAALSRAVEQSQSARDLAEDRYARGLDGIITLLSAQRDAFRSESQLLQVQRLRLDARVDLHLALGGGFSPSRPEDPTVDTNERP
ncbi:MAG: TolC family protein, partial [Planctomycetes bacterium]|nr:TolC family protein [Planctomycetota bacterium]